MRIPISEIKVNPGRREAKQESVRELAGSIRELGLLTPITVDRDHALIAGLHRLEAAKLLNWAEIECTVSDLTGLQAELAEIDENFVRAELGTVDFGNLLLKRKEIYEALHPETKAGISQAAGMNRAVGNNVGCNLHPTSKSFVRDTAEKLGVNPSTIKRQLQIAKNLTPATKEIIQGADTKITKQTALKLSRLPPERQEEAAQQLAAGNRHAVDSYQPPPAQPALQARDTLLPPDDVPYSLGDKIYATFEESVADLKNHDKDCSYTPDTLLADMDGFIERFHRDFAWYADPFCTVVFPQISQVQFEYIKKRFYTIISATEHLLHQMEGMIHP